MSLAQDRLNYITRESVNLTSNVTLAQVSRDTGIPYSTLWKTRNGSSELPKKYTKTLQQYYSQQAYYNLRATGMNSTQASRFRNGNPSNVSELTGKVYDALDYYSTGTTIAVASKKGYYPSPDEIKQIYKDSMKKIQEGLGKSKQSVEDWIQWGS